MSDKKNEKAEEKKNPNYDPRKKFVDDGVGIIIHRVKPKKKKK